MSRTEAIFHSPDSGSLIEVDGYWYPFMNDVARHNLGYGSEMNAALDLVTDWTCAIDGGSQIGRVANRLAKKFDKVFAIELAWENYKCLEKNAAPNVIPIRACLCAEKLGNVGYQPDKHPDSPVYRVTPNGNVPTVMIDELPFDSCGFIKLDLQGYDYFALKGAVETLKRHHPVIYFEYDPSCFERYGVHRSAHQIYLESLGYRYIGTEDGNQIWA